MNVRVLESIDENSHTCFWNRCEMEIKNEDKDKTWRDCRDRLRNRNPHPDTFGIDKKIQKRLFGNGDKLESVLRPVTRILNQANETNWTPSFVPSAATSSADASTEAATDFVNPLFCK